MKTKTIFLIIKDLKKFGGGRKRFQYSSAYVRADAERLKRLAAIECLISASDQVAFKFLEIFPSKSLQILILFIFSQRESNL